MKILLNFLLYCVARLLTAIFMPIGILWAIIFKFKETKKYFWHLAIAYDQLGNVACQYPLNFVFTKSGGKLHGDPDQTVSYVTGINKLANKLTLLGRGLAWLLNVVEYKHVEKAVENEKNNITDKYKSL